MNGMYVSLSVGVTGTFLSHWDSESDRVISKYWLRVECTLSLTLTLRQMPSKPFTLTCLILLKERSVQPALLLFTSRGQWGRECLGRRGKRLSTWGVGGSVSQCLHLKHLGG